MWITNGGAADLFTVFAKVGGEKFTAFLVERAFRGVTSGAEEKKMGIKGSSTTAVYFDNVQGAGGERARRDRPRPHHRVQHSEHRAPEARTIRGRRVARTCCAISLKYAKERKAFGTTIAEFGMIQHKLAEMAIRIYAAESMSYRVVGLIEAQLEDSPGPARRAQTMLKAVEEYAAECSIIKVFASEVLDYVVDEGVQIHGGYGYHQDYAVERAYRDSRINRIFEGTNEINRLLITGMLLKRAARGPAGLVQAAQKVMGEILSGPSGDRWARAKRRAWCATRRRSRCC